MQSLVMLPRKLSGRPLINGHSTQIAAAA